MLRPRHLAYTAALIAAQAGAQTATAPAAPAAKASEAQQALPQVVVSATRTVQKITDAPASISVVTREELAKRPYMTLLDAVRDIEGVDVGETTDKTGQGTISIRGMGADYTLVLIDGRRQNSNGDLYPNSFGGNQFNHIPPIEAIERIEVIRGPMSTLYGADALGGVINIITRKIPQQWMGSATQTFTVQEKSELGNDRSTDFNLMGPVSAGPLGKLGVQVRGSVYHRDPSLPQYPDVVYPNGETRPRALGFGGGGKTVDNDSYNLGGRIAYSPDAQHELVLDVETSRQKYDNTPLADGSFPLGTVDSIATIWRTAWTGTATNGRACSATNATGTCKEVAAPQVGYVDKQRFTRDQAALTYRGSWGAINSDIGLSWVNTANEGRTLPFTAAERESLYALWAAVPGANANAKLANMTAAQRAQLNAFLPRPARTMETRELTLDAKFDMQLGAHLLVFGGQWVDGEMEDGVFSLSSGRPGTTQPHKQKAVFVEDSWAINPALTLTGGVRVDNHSKFGTQTSPRLYAVWQVAPGWTVKGGLSTGYKAPKTSQLFPGITGFGGQGTSPFAGNPNLQPETSKNGELAVYFDGKDGAGFNATIFQNRFKDKIVSGDSVPNCEVAAPGVRCADIGDGWADLGYVTFSQSYNIDRADIQGAELAGRYRPLSNLTLRANYTYTDSKQKSGAATGQPLSGSAKHMANAAVSWRVMQPLELTLNLEAVSDRFRSWDTAANKPLYYKSYQMLHLGGSYEVNKNWRINARINNLLDHDFTSYATSFVACTTGATCVGGQQPSFTDDYNVKAKARNFWIAISGRF